MPLLRIEPKLDPASDRYFLEIYWPADSDRPFVTTAPRYASSAAAETDLIAIIASTGNHPKTDA